MFLTFVFTPVVLREWWASGLRQTTTMAEFHNHNHISFASSSLLCQENQTCFSETGKEEDCDLICSNYCDRFSLLCQENQTCFSETGKEEDCDLICSNYCDRLSLYSEEENEEYIQKLCQKEILGCKIDYSTISESWLIGARLNAVEWIFKTRSIFNFQLYTAYLSITFLDLFLSKRCIEGKKRWVIPLLSVACLSLAAKMVELMPPTLSEYSTEDYAFENKVIQRMELMVLSTLQWKMSCITPFDYLHYFINKFCGESRPTGLISKALDLIMAITKEVVLVDQRPSVIAAAAVLAASDNQLTRKALELKMDFIKLWGSLGNEHIFSCYNKMQEIEMRKSKTPNFVISSHYPSIGSNCIHVNESTGVSTGAGSKRKLTFNETDQNAVATKTCRS